MMFSNAQLRLRYPSIEAIDFYLAQQLCQSLASQCDVLQHILIALSESLRNGHSCLSLMSEAGFAGIRRWNTGEQEGYLFPSQTQLMQVLSHYTIGPEDGAPIVLHGTKLYLRRYWHYEQKVAQQLLQRMQPQILSASQTKVAENLLAQLFISTTNTHATDQIDWQAQAVRDALSRQVCVLAGGPGTGKTYTVARLIVTLQAVNKVPLVIAMAAPTGKAKQRLLESIHHAKLQLEQQGIEAWLIDSIPIKAHTLHGLLGLRPNSQYIKYHQGNPLSIDVLLVDEASMVDLPMMARLLDALPSHCRLVLVGDAEQLPSVAAGSILADIPASAISYLHLSRRFDGGGGIGLLATQVMQNLAQDSWQQLQHSDVENPQLQLVNDEQYQQWLQQVCNEYFVPMLKAHTLQHAFGYLAQFRILAATRQGDRGVEGINQQLENLLSRSCSNVRKDQHYQGKPVMVTKNHHGLDLYNGDIGIVWPQEDGQLAVCFEHAGGTTRRVNVGLLQDLETVYAMTIHKTQGSEFEHVGLVLAPQAEPLLSSQLLYTAITRAKQRCSICTNQVTWRRAVTNKTQRWSGLNNLLSE